VNLQQLNPWNWFQHENDSASSVPVKRDETSQPTRSTSDSITQLHNEIDQLFEDAFRSFGFPSRYTRSLGTGGLATGGLLNAQPFQAKVNIASDDKNYHISLETPGLTEKDINLDIRQGVLTIRGEKKEEKEETKDRHYYRIEHTYGSFQRVLTLPEDVDQDGISASLKNGILEISLPRKALPESERKQIPINSNNSSTT